MISIENHMNFIFHSYLTSILKKNNGFLIETAYCCSQQRKSDCSLNCEHSTSFRNTVPAVLQGVINHCKAQSPPFGSFYK